MKHALPLVARAALIAAAQAACRDAPLQPSAPNDATDAQSVASPTARAIATAEGVTIVDLGRGGANAINEAGMVAGWAGDWNTPTAHAWYVDGSSRDIVVPCPPACGLTPFPGCEPLGDPFCTASDRGTPSQALGVNDHGDVVGYYSYRERPTYTTYTDAFIWSAALGVRRPFAYHHDTRLFAINDAGQAVGNDRFPNTSSQYLIAVLREADGTRRFLGAPGVMSVAYGVNARGDAVGQSPGPFYGYDQAPMLWQAGGATIKLETFGGSENYAAAQAINDAGTVVGWSSTGASYSRVKLPFRWTSARGLEALPVLVGGGAAYGINDDGYIVGEVEVNHGNGTSHAALWTPDGKLIDLGTLGGGTSTARGINSALQIAGSADDAVGGRHAVRWSVEIAHNGAPVIAAHGPYGGAEGAPIAFAGSASDPDGDPLAYGWAFGDGASAAGATASHSYLDDGAFTATLTATDSKGLSASAPASVTVANVAPVLRVDSSTRLVSGESFTLHAAFTDAGVRDMPWRYSVDWGTGAPTDASTVSQTSPILAPSPRYCAAGTYTVRATLADKDGGVGGAVAVVSVDRATIPFDVLTGTLNARSRGKLPVAVLSTARFDARELDAATVTLGDGNGRPMPVARRPNGRPFASVEDVNGDGRPDLVLHFEREPLSAQAILAAGPSTQLVLLGRLADGCSEVRGTETLSVLAK